MDDYDVFLNHRGPDVKGGFIAHLDEALRSVGLNPFLDKQSLVKGDPAFSSIYDALQVAKVHVAVVSKGYAESKYCLNELVAMMRSGKPVIPVFYDVEPAHLRRVQNGPFGAAFVKHMSRESLEQVEQWTDVLRKLAGITGFCLSDYRGDEAELKQEVVNAIMSLTSTNEALQADQHVVGLEEPVNTCIQELEKMCGARGFLGLVGMGGVGKTSLAKEIYNHLVGRKKFQFMSFLQINSSSSSNIEVGLSLLKQLQKQLLWDLLRVPNDNPHSYKYWFDKLSSQGPILVVLDDIHDKRQFEELILDTRVFASGSRIIVTSRDQHLLKLIAREMSFYLHEVTTLGCDDSEKLFNWHAFSSEEAPKKFKALAQVVSKACFGLPLALKVVGSSLFDKRSFEDRKSIWPEAIDALKGDPDVMNALKWSYNCLLDSEKLMFLDIACVFFGWEKQTAIEIWNSCKKCTSCCGSGTPHTSLRRLVDKSMVVVQKEGSKEVLAMHDLLRNLGQDIGSVDESHLWEDRTAKAIVDKSQDTTKVRALNLANNQDRKFGIETFAKMCNLHFLVFDGCDVSGDLGSMWKELRWLRWRYMPLLHLPTMVNLSNLISMDLSNSTKLANLWIESNPNFQAWPNLLLLNLSGCTSITQLPDSIGHLSRLQVLDLHGCENLHKLPSSIGHLTALQKLLLFGCRNLEALPDTIGALSGLQWLEMNGCSSISKLPTTFGLLTGLVWLYTDLVTEWQAVSIGQLNALSKLVVLFGCTDEIITFLDSSRTLRNLGQLSMLCFWGCTSITKVPETIGLLTNLVDIQLIMCEKLEKLPTSIGQLKVLRVLGLIECNSVETLPDSLGELELLESLEIQDCTSFTKLPTSIGHLSRLLGLRIQGCVKLQLLPHSIRQLNALEFLRVSECGSLEDLGALTALQGLRIWGCTSITEIPGSSLMVVDIHAECVGVLKKYEKEYMPRNCKKSHLLEENDCGFLRVHEEDLAPPGGQMLLLRVHNSPYCCQSTLMSEERFLFLKALIEI